MFSRDLILKDVSELNGLFGSLLDQFLGSFDRANGLSYSNSMEFESLTFQQKILVDGFNGLVIVV